MHFRYRYKTIRLYVTICGVLLSLLYGLFLFHEYQIKRDIVRFAQCFAGVPYRYGGADPDGFDCSGYIMYLFHEFGQELPRTADQQAVVGKPVAANDLQPGDVLFFAVNSGAEISHCGLYIGNSNFIHASSGAGKVIISSLQNPYWRNTLRQARKFMDSPKR